MILYKNMKALGFFSPNSDNDFFNTILGVFKGDILAPFLGVFQRDILAPFLGVLQGGTLTLFLFIIHPDNPL